MENEYRFYEIRIGQALMVIKIEFNNKIVSICPSLRFIC